ncbi:hypothetical protein [Staphylococcus xylosus]|uniref:hypothetical protein n=1 Tax=Staphylococcus xylosus TaxID=1288 RepID=UPI00034CEFC5|nr:hypothetical protein [Staphylococcus xylosus]
MKIKDLNKYDRVIVHDLGKSEYSEGMRVVGNVTRLANYVRAENEEQEDGYTVAVIEQIQGIEYVITDDNHFELWSNYIESKTESVSSTAKIILADQKQSNDLQQRKRSCGVIANERLEMIQPGECVIPLSNSERAQFIEQVVEGFDAVTAYNIGKAIEHIFEYDSEQAKKSLERAYENWD